ncbi:phage portal protein [Pseudohongiella spirulinae]|uniref:Phage portal protein, lambda n=1 Tax=Pseudohongiella spirulinae TaxID=1249552 RepID=A0A0S2KEQ2_9GAMM|nr:phage portal protein [Pseudohongiella spirulinae]ALO46579.1 Phage portal protein, lambda [Pseudohongiella spirulinae]
MTNALDKTIGFLFPGWGASRAFARAKMNYLGDAMNKYDAAGKGRNGWTRGSDSSANMEIGAALPRVRAFSRDLRRNNPYASKISDSLVFNVVGAGIVPGAKHSSERKRKRAQELMQDWSWTTDCDADGRMNLFGLQSLAFRTENDSGEALIVRQIVNDPTMAVPLKIRVLEGDFLDHTKNVTALSNGGRIVQGVEFDAQGRRAAYWLFEDHPGEYGFRRFNSKRHDAANVIHLYEIRRPGQVRGMPRGAAGFLRLKNVDEFQDAVLGLQKVAACFGAFIKSDDPSKKAGDILPEKMEPAMLTKLSYMEDVSYVTPPTTSGHAEYLTTELMGASAPSGVTYQAATGDLRGVNFSSGKMGFIEFGRTISHLQKNMLIPLLCQGIEKWFIEAAALRGINLSGVYYEWTPPRREMIDPPKELPAISKAIQGKLKSFSDWARENNRDPDEWAKEIADDMKRFRDLEVDLFDKQPKEEQSNAPNNEQD